MSVRAYSVRSGRLIPRPLSEPIALDPTASDDTWYDLAEVGADELHRLLEPLDLHPLILERCLNPGKAPGVITYGGSVLLAYPVAAPVTGDATYLSLTLTGHLLITVRHGAVSTLDELRAELEKGGGRTVHHLTEMLYLILDEITDQVVASQAVVRDRTRSLAAAISQDTSSVSPPSLDELRMEVDAMAALLENQLYCVTGLSASESPTLNEPHRHAYLQDLVSELEIALRSVYRLDGRVDDLLQELSAASDRRVEKRLRLLTIVSAITLPLGLLTGLLGMNVGGLPGTDLRFGFWLVVLIMAAVSAGLILYFRREGWFD